MADIINEIFIFILGCFFVSAPFIVNTAGFWFLFACGLWFFSGLILSYTLVARFDSKFKEILLNDKDLENKLPLALLSPRLLVSFRLVRAVAYARNIVFPKNSAKNPIQYSWFHGYPFRQHARKIDFIAAYLFMISFGFAVIFGLIMAVLQLFGISF